jgi:hypothetical protein
MMRLVKRGVNEEGGGCDALLMEDGAPAKVYLAKRGFWVRGSDARCWPE